MGLYVLGSRQVVDEKSRGPETFIVETVSGPLASMLRAQSFNCVSLQSSVSRSDVFKKMFLSFFVDEKKVARVAAGRDCKTALIVYYSYTGNNVVLDSGVKVYERCSLYGWLVSADTQKILASSHRMLPSYVSYIEKNHPGLHEGTFIAGKAVVTESLYKEFLVAQTKEMFGSLRAEVKSSKKP